MNTIKSVFGSAYSLLGNVLSKTMSKLAIASKNISFTYHFVRLIIKAKAPYYRFSCHPHIVGLECAIVCILNPAVSRSYWDSLVVEHWTKSAWRKITVIGHCLRLIVKMKDHIEDPPYVHDIVDKSYETIAIYTTPDNFDWEEHGDQLSWELPLFPPDDEDATEAGSTADWHILRQLRFRQDTFGAARSLGEPNFESPFEAPQLY